jgi:hypothetical protein
VHADDRRLSTFPPIAVRKSAYGQLHAWCAGLRECSVVFLLFFSNSAPSRRAVLPALRPRAGATNTRGHARSTVAVADAGHRLPPRFHGVYGCDWYAWCVNAAHTIHAMNLHATQARDGVCGAPTTALCARRSIRDVHLHHLAEHVGLPGAPLFAGGHGGHGRKDHGAGGGDL